MSAQNPAGQYPPCPNNPEDIASISNPCQRYFCRTGTNLNQEKLSTVLNDLYADGIGCVNNNQASCVNFCRDLTKNPDRCYECLGQTSTCPDNKCRTPLDCSLSENANSPCCTENAGCCPLAQDAIECSACISSKGTATMDTVRQCTQPSGISRTTTIVIIVVVLVVVIIIITAVVVALKLRKSAKNRQALINDLKQKGVNSKVIQQIGNLDYSKIDSKVFKDVDVNLLKKAGQRAKPAVNKDATQLTNESDGLFSL